VSLASGSRNSSSAVNYPKCFFFTEEDDCTLIKHCRLIPLSLPDIEKLTLVQLTKKWPTFTEPESSHRVHKKLSLVPTMRHIQLVHTLKPIYFKSLLILSLHLHLGFPFREKNLHAFPVSTTCSTCHAHLILLDFVTLKVLNYEYGE